MGQELPCYGASRATFCFRSSDTILDRTGMSLISFVVFVILLRLGFSWRIPQFEHLATIPTNHIFVYTLLLGKDRKREGCGFFGYLENAWAALLDLVSFCKT
jgi:hypothetical protein